MFRPITAQDEAVYYRLADAFYHSEAVDHVVPETHIHRTFQTLMSGSPYAACYLFEAEGRPAGFALLAFTWSQEAGGPVVWVEELYVLPEFRGHGLGMAFLEALPGLYPDAARLRLEIEPDNEKAGALYRRMGYEPLNYQQMIQDFPLQSGGEADKMSL